MDKSPLESLVVRVQGDNHFVASRLSEFKQTRKLDENGIAEFLCCKVEQLPRLSLCVAPEPNDLFPINIQKIASFVGCDANRLAMLVRECDALRVATNQRTEQAMPYSLAARDRKNCDGSAAE